MVRTEAEIGVVLEREGVEVADRVLDLFRKVGGALPGSVVAGPRSLLCRVRHRLRACETGLDVVRLAFPARLARLRGFSRLQDAYISGRARGCKQTAVKGVRLCLKLMDPTRDRIRMGRLVYLPRLGNQGRRLTRCRKERRFGRSRRRRGLH